MQLDPVGVVRTEVRTGNVGPIITNPGSGRGICSGHNTQSGGSTLSLITQLIVPSCGHSSLGHCSTNVHHAPRVTSVRALSGRPHPESIGPTSIGTVPV